MNYPTGFTNDNSRIISGGVKDGNAWYINDSRIQLIQTNDDVQVSVSAYFFSKPCFVTLMKI